MRTHTLLLLLALLAACGPDRGRSDGGSRSGRTTCLQVDTVEAFGFEVFTFEASRPSATAESAGSGAALPACSEHGVLPWSEVTRAEADAACQATGFELCTQEQWLLACGGPDHLPFPYGPEQRKGVCNDTQGGSHALETTGNRPECLSEYGTYDIIGNVWEWVADRGSGGEGKYIGHSYLVWAIRPTAPPRCEAALQTPQANYNGPQLGFRCCRAL